MSFYIVNSCLTKTVIYCIITLPFLRLIICIKQFKVVFFLDNIYKEVVEEYNLRLAKLQEEHPDILEKYLCLCRLQDASASKKAQEYHLKMAKKFLGIPEHKKRMGLFGPKIDEEYVISKLIVETDRVAILRIAFENGLKRAAKKSGLTANHVSGVAPEKLLGGVLITSKNRLTQYEEKRGDFLFATTLPERKNLYCVRSASGPSSGMIRIDGNNYLFPSDKNFEISDKLKLKKPKTVYELDVDKFTPETKFSVNKEGNYCFEFDDEWYSTENFKVFDENYRSLIKTRMVEDVTDVLDDYNLYVSVDHKKALDILDEKNINSSFGFGYDEALKYCVKNGIIVDLRAMIKQNKIKAAIAKGVKEDDLEQIRTEAPEKNRETAQEECGQTM